MNVRLSVLDLIPVRSNQTSADALAATVELAKVADGAGLTRYWVAEHHNTRGVAATSPPVLLAMLGAHTHTIRLGSGGVMLPNHAPMAVAEQFALLEAAYPDRIDLGIGRAPGTDPVTSWALRSGGGRDDKDIENFPTYLDHVAAFMDPDGIDVQLSGRVHTIKATPVPTSIPKMWLLGSSMYSAHLAAAKGLPYVFAHHFSGQGTAEALATYRAEFQPSDHAATPETFLTVNVCVAPTADEAHRIVLGQAQNTARLYTGGALGPMATIEEADVYEPTPAEAATIPSIIERSVVGDPRQAADQIRELAEQFGVDEVMLHLTATDSGSTDVRRSINRERTVELLAAELL